MRTFLLLLSIALLTTQLPGAEETIRGVLEQTKKSGACAQITDALGEIYYIVKTDDAEKAVAEFVGKNIKVVLKGTVETRAGDLAYFFNLKTIARYVKEAPKEASPPKTPPPPENSPKPQK